ncbi:MAG TPA: hypothetical protein VJW96_10640 [Terriglobales bacterium]|nr:hypothetical protein [Terriglobales bacterium]
MEISTQYDRITQTCFAYLLTQDESAKYHTFCSLVAYCRRAIGHLYAPSEYETTTSIKTDPGLKDGLPGVFSDDAGTRTVEWVQMWVLQFLAPYFSATPGELEQEADKGTFRYFGRKCRLALINHIRKFQRKRGRAKVRRTLSNPATKDGAASDSFIDFVVRDDATDPIVWIRAHQPDLREIGVYDVCLSLFEQYLEGTGATERLSELWGVSVRQAQNKRRQVIERIRTELRNDPLIREMFNIIAAWQDRTTRLPFLQVARSPEAVANERLLEEAAQDGREFRCWVQKVDNPDDKNTLG